jgi:hypothetical protein
VESKYVEYEDGRVGVEATRSQCSLLGIASLKSFELLACVAIK